MIIYWQTASQVTTVGGASMSDANVMNNTDAQAPPLWRLLHNSSSWAFPKQCRVWL